jgi:hypothetical protein
MLDPIVQIHETPVLVEEGMVRCPLRKFDGMARDACVAQQARRGDGCGFGCCRGRAALEERARFDEETAREDAIREAVKLKHTEYNQKWPKPWVPTGRPRGRPRKRPEPCPGGRRAVP